MVFIPTGFTPNGDANNDIFYIHTGKGVRKLTSFRIYNRWGGLVFEATDIPANDPAYGWDGNVGGSPMNSDVFVVFVEAEFEDGLVQSFKSDMTLMR